jgi:peroxiredoxin Q/BCP
MAKKKMTKKVAKKIVKKTAKKPVKKVVKATKKVAKKAVKAVKKATKKAAKKATKKVAAKPAKKAVKKATKKVVKAPAKKAVKAPAKKVVTAVKKAAPAPKAPVQSAEVIKAPTLNVGDMAPDFTLQDQNGKEVSLHDFAGMNVVVYFYPKAMTPGCTVQACEIRNSEAELKEAGIVVLGISADPVKSLKKFEEKERLNFTLLSDVDKKAINAYGTWGPKKFMGRDFDGILRQSYFIGKDGKVLHVMHKVDTKTHHADILDFFKNL